MLVQRKMNLSDNNKDLPTCTSSNNPFPHSPPTTIILFPITVAACCQKKKSNKSPS